LEGKNDRGGNTQDVNPEATKELERPPKERNKEVPTHTALDTEKGGGTNSWWVGETRGLGQPGEEKDIKTKKKWKDKKNHHSAEGKKKRKTQGGGGKDLFRGLRERNRG